MVKKYVMLVLVLIVMALFTGSKVTADEITDYYMDVPRKPLQVMEDLYKSVMSMELDHARKTVRMLDDLYKTYMFLLPKSMLMTLLLLYLKGYLK